MRTREIDLVQMLREAFDGSEGSVENELTRLYIEQGGADKDTSVDDRLWLTKALLASAIINAQNESRRIERTEQLLPVLDILADEQDTEVQALVSHYRIMTYLAKFPFDEDELLETGKRLSEHGQYEEALACFDALRLKNPNHLWVDYDKGHTLTKLRRFDEAFACFLRAVELNPYSTYTNSTFAEALLRRGEHERAKNHLASALEKDYQNAHAIHVATKLSEELDPASLLAGRGLDDYTQANALIAVGHFFSKFGKHGEAAKYFAKAKQYLEADLKKDYQNANAISLIADLPSQLEPASLLGDRKPEDYTSDDALHHVGKTLRILGDFERSITFFDFLIKKNPDYRWARIEEAKAVMALDRLNIAIANRLAADKNPDGRQARIEEAKALVSIDPLNKAIALCEEEVRINPHPSSFNDLGMYLLENDCFFEEVLKKAKFAFEQSLKLNPNNEWALYRLGFCNWRLGNPEESKAQLDSARELGSPDSNLRLKLSEEYKSLGWFCWLNRGEDYKKVKEEDFEKARAAFKAAIELNPEDGEAYHRLGVCNYRQANITKEEHSRQAMLEEARDALEESLKLRYDRWADADLGACYLGLKENKKAEEHLRTAKEQGADAGWVDDCLGVAYIRLKTYAEAEEQFKGAISKGFDKGSVHSGLGYSLEKQGKNQEARQAYQTAVEKGYEPAKERLTKLDGK